MTKTEYRITAERPVDGRMRKVGSTVLLTEKQFEAEKGWGGIEPVTAEAEAVEPAKVEPETPKVKSGGK